MPEGIKKVFVTGIETVSDTDLEEVGTLRWRGNKVYKWVRYSTGTSDVAAVAGNATYYIPATGYTASLVTSDVSDGIVSSGIESGICAGVLVAAPTDDQYCWIQIKGGVTLAQAIVDAAADGEMFGIAGAGTELDGAFIRVIDSRVPVAGYMQENATKRAVLDCAY
jgi:hypothetical protein